MILHKERLHTSVKVVVVGLRLLSWPAVLPPVTAGVADLQLVGPTLRGAGLHVDGVGVLLAQRFVFL